MSSQEYVDYVNSFADVLYDILKEAKWKCESAGEWEVSGYEEQCTREWIPLIEIRNPKGELMQVFTPDHVDFSESAAISYCQGIYDCHKSMS